MDLLIDEWTDGQTDGWTDAGEVLLIKARDHGVGCSNMHACALEGVGVHNLDDIMADRVNESRDETTNEATEI